MAEEVHPKCDAMEEKWWADQEHQSLVSAAHLKHSDLPIKTIQAWCQLRLQGFFTQAPFNDRVRCLMCNMIAPACWEHWNEECKGTSALFKAEAWPVAAADRNLKMCQPETYAQAVASAKMAGKLQKMLWDAFHAAGRQAVDQPQ